MFPQYKPQWVGPSGEGLGLEGLLPSRSKVQHLLGAINSLGPHSLVKSQRFILIRVGKFPRVRCTNPVGLVEARASWPGHPMISKKKKVNWPTRNPMAHHFFYYSFYLESMTTPSDTFLRGKKNHLS